MTGVLVAAWHAKISFAFEVNFNEGFQPKERNKTVLFFLSLNFKGRRNEHLKLPFYDVRNDGSVFEPIKTRP